MIIALASDHHGISLKAQLMESLAAEGHQTVDLGPQNTDPVDYPDFAEQVAQRVAAGEADRGILICGTGVGMAIAANKVPGVRAAVCHDEGTAILSREHNDANVLCLAGKHVSAPVNVAIAKAWVATAFEGGRHARRVNKIHDLENRYCAS